ncbi:DbpA RNA binding domain-containing protein, partial [Pseudovibrio sp. POLY-S9]|uniref:DbpA RNA binding domain-containing protein n=1 Tax=Pseudovibrio sp. POLY-S9 TaxID=1576596 RepID=UPI0019107611
HQGLPAPEELLATSNNFDSERERKPRKDFDNGVWFRLNVGRKHNAEPRWLLPMICRAGHITKKDIGSIRIFDADARFELDAKLADKFLETVKENGTGEKSITITRIEGNPERSSSGRPGGNRNNRGGGGGGGYRGEGGRGGEGRGRGRREGGGGGGYRGGEGRGRG